MINRRPYVSESAIKPGTAVVQGSADNKVKAAGEGGDFIGVYPFEANGPKAAGDPIGIVLHGPVKVLAGGTVVAGKPAVFGEDGSFELVPEGEGQYTTAGTFLESGSSGEYVDLFVERGSVTVSE